MTTCANEDFFFFCFKANGQLLNINLIQNPSVKKLAERYLQCVNDFRQLQWQVCNHLSLIIDIIN